MRQILNRQPRLALGFKVALVVLAHGRVAASSAALGNAAMIPPQQTNLPEKRVVHELLAQESEEAKVAGLEVVASAASVFETLADAAETSATRFNYFFQQPMSYDHLRVWLSCYNAGPYATLKYKGDVPYRETRNYTPRVMKYYKMDLTDSPYEPYIATSAKKYGLDPQMVRAIMKTESDFRNSCVSGAGARGLMQVMPCVWSEIKKRYSLEWNYQQGVFNPEQNIEVACAYLAWLRYDFLPKHFAGFDPNPVTPPDLVRDTQIKDRVNRVVMAASGIPQVGTPLAKGVNITISQAKRIFAANAAKRNVSALAKKTVITSSKVGKKTVSVQRKSRSRKSRS